jgi:hypothetical protein
MRPVVQTCITVGGENKGVPRGVLFEAENEYGATIRGLIWHVSANAAARKTSTWHSICGGIPDYLPEVLS